MSTLKYSAGIGSYFKVHSQREYNPSLYTGKGCPDHTHNTSVAHFERFVGCADSAVTSLCAYLASALAVCSRIAIAIGGCDAVVQYTINAERRLLKATERESLLDHNNIRLTAVCKIWHARCFH